ncbi:MAG: carboxypeptidase regulatory-like domain-containing protein [Planctomycetes bacterium]|nr:carboxypeptidase regulatory-like domain-containing protein [Planctomycetota bacterium]
MPIRSCSRRSPAVHALFAWGLLLSLTGCSNPLRTYPVSGKVVFDDGSPVRVGTIEFKSMDHQVQARGTIERDGSYHLTTFQENDGAVAGRHRVVVVQMIVVEDAPGIKVGKRGVVHPKFNSYSTSGLELEVVPGEPNNLVVTVTGIEGAPAKEDHDHSHE